MQISFTLASLLRSNQFVRRLGSLLSALVLVGLVLVSVGEPLCALAQSPPGDPRPIQASDLYRMQEIQDLALSPTGRFAAYTVRRVGSGPRQSTAAEAVHRTQLLVTPTSGRTSPQLLTRSEKGARQPTWHPDGSHLAFVRPVEGTPQVFIVSLSGGEPYQLTDFPYGVQNPQWSPNGERILFASAIPKSAVRRADSRSDGAGPPRTSQSVFGERPGRTPGDLVRSPAPDTVLVLRHAQSLDAVDTLALGPQGRPQLRADTARALRTPEEDAALDSLARRVSGRLDVLSSDSLRAVFDSLRLRPDTTALPVAPDTAATPNGNLVQVRRWLNQTRQVESALVSTRLDLQGENGLAPVPTYRHHFVVEVPSSLRATTPPRPRAERVTGGDRTYGEAEWLPGNSQIVVSGTPPSDRPIDRVRQRNLYVVDLNRDRTQRLLRLDHHALTAPNVTDDGSKVAFRVHPLTSTRDYQTEVGLFATDGRSEPRILTSGLDRDVRTIRWSPEGWYLYATAPSRGGVPVYRFSPFAADTTSGTPSMSPDQAVSRDTFALDSTMVRPASYQRMTEAARAVHEFDVTTASAVYVATDPSAPSTLYANTVSFGNERRLSNHNAEWLSRRRLATPERTTIPSGSLAVDGWLTRPAPLVDSLQYPLLVQVRGGPSGSDALHTPEAWFERQYLAAQGFALVEVLPRGSTGYGLFFRRANDANWGPGPGQDVLAVADSVATVSWIDSSSQALTGTSYGGTLTAWLLAHTDRFDAAVAFNGAYDLSALLDRRQSWRRMPQEFGGYPWEGTPMLSTGPPALTTGRLPSFNHTSSPWMALHRNSPITFVDQIHTPLLLLQSGADQQMGPAQSERLYKRLKILDRPVEYVRYPDVGHDVAASATPAQRLDRLVRTYEYLARFLTPPSPSGPPRPAASSMP